MHNSYRKYYRSLWLIIRYKIVYLHHLQILAVEDSPQEQDNQVLHLDNQEQQGGNLVQQMDNQGQQEGNQVQLGGNQAGQLDNHHTSNETNT